MGPGGVSRWAKEDIFLHSLILIPINYVTPSKHWCLVAIDVKRETITYFDSTGGIDHTAIQNIQNYLEQESISGNFLVYSWQGPPPPPPQKCA